MGKRRICRKLQQYLSCIVEPTRGACIYLSTEHRLTITSQFIRTDENKGRKVKLGESLAKPRSFWHNQDAAKSRVSARKAKFRLAKVAEYVDNPVSMPQGGRNWRQPFRQGSQGESKKGLLTCVCGRSAASRKSWY